MADLVCQRPECNRPYILRERPGTLVDGQYCSGYCRYRDSPETRARDAEKEQRRLAAREAKQQNLVAAREAKAAKRKALG